MHLLTETCNVMASIPKYPNDILFIGSKGTKEQCTWEEFKTLADIEYDNGYGTEEIIPDLIIIFTDGSAMQREKYDGSEWWEYEEPFILPTIRKTLKSLKI